MLGLPPVAIEPGAPADLVVLDRDPYEIDWTESVPTVRLTIGDGVVRHG